MLPTFHLKQFKIGFHMLAEESRVATASILKSASRPHFVPLTNNTLKFNVSGLLAFRRRFQDGRPRRKAQVSAPERRPSQSAQNGRRRRQK
jgi:hypothetical protein